MLSALLVLLLTLLFFYHWRRRELYVCSWQLDGPFAWPLIGNLPLFRKGREYVFETTKEVCAKYASPQRFWLGPFFIVYLTDPDDVQIVLNHPNALEKTYIYKLGNDWIGGSLLTSPVSKWRRHRSLIQTTFSLKILESYMPKINRQSDLMVRRLNRHVGETFDVFDELFETNFRTICETAFDTEMDDPEVPKKFIAATNRMFEIFQWRDMRLWLYPDFMFHLTDAYRNGMKPSCEYVHSVTDAILDAKLKEWRERLTLVENPASLERNNFIDELIFHSLVAGDPEKRLTRDEIRTEMDLMIIAGSDSNSHALAYALLMLGAHQDVQDRVFEEIQDVQAELTAGFVDREALKRLVYLDQVLNETMRLLPTAPMIARDLVGDVQLKSGSGVRLVRGTTVGIGIRDLQRSRKAWGEDAETFNPDRFAPEKRAKMHPYAFLPFSGGPRNCVGLKLARWTMLVMLFKIVKRYRIETDERLEDIRCALHPLAKKYGGWNIRIKERRAVRFSNIVLEIK